MHGQLVKTYDESGPVQSKQWQRRRRRRRGKQLSLYSRVTYISLMLGGLRGCEKVVITPPTPTPSCDNRVDNFTYYDVFSFIYVYVYICMYVHNFTIHI